KITFLFPQLELDLQKQLEVKKTIDETLYDYEVQTKCTDLVASDIEEKAKLYLACKKLEGLSNKTLYNYRLFLEKLDQYFTKPCSTISTMDLRMFIALMGKDKKASTVNGYITYLKNFFGWLQNEEYIIKNPAAKLKQTKVPKVVLQGYKADNLEKLREACKTEKEKSLFELLDSTACRISEIDNIKLEDINWQEQSIVVTGKGNKQRIVYFSTKAKLHMMAYIGERKEGYLFISDKAPHQHIKVRALQLILSKIKDRAGVTERVHCHKFRRTQATYLLNSGMTIQGVQKILGHT
ncbi:tyrosine-type recombinase/integrase, partial [Clostridium neonatale]|uniref:tyrosine-type recombinase/integrase n=1 Tax=Clostridium neonatale TaxID=137838 RepID=UPI001E534B45